MSLNSQTLGNGQEQHESFVHPYKRGNRLCQYDYRHTDGELFSCIAKSLEAARTKRDEWLTSRAA